MTIDTLFLWMSARNLKNTKKHAMKKSILKKKTKNKIHSMQCVIAYNIHLL